MVEALPSSRCAFSGGGAGSGGSRLAAAVRGDRGTALSPAAQTDGAHTPGGRARYRGYPCCRGIAPVVLIDNGYVVASAKPAIYAIPLPHRGLLSERQCAVRRPIGLRRAQPCRPRREPDRLSRETVCGRDERRGDVEQAGPAPVGRITCGTAHRLVWVLHAGGGATGGWTETLIVSVAICPWDRSR
jgi:hypothetical protein